MIKLYLINFLLALSTSIGMTITPLLAVDTLGLSFLMLGLIEGGSELLSNSLRFYSGSLFDRVKNKKVLFIYATFAAFGSKACILLGGVSSIILSKFCERISNGFFAAPRDAYIGTNSKNAGKTLGLMVGFKTFGCILGAFFISLISFKLNILENIKIIILICCFLTLSSLIISFFIENNFNKSVKNNVTRVKYSDFNKITLRILPILILSSLFFLGRFNDGNIILYLKKLNFPEFYYTATIGIFNFSMAICSPILGFFIDKNSFKSLTYVTIFSLLLFNIIFFFLPCNNLYLATIGLIFWGLQRASAQILFTAMIFKTIEKKYYGTAIGIYSLVSGISVLLASSISGFIAKYDFSYIFIYSFIINILSILYFTLFNIKNAK